MKTKHWITGVFLLVAVTAMAQNRYVVHFTDKENSPYNVNQPEEFLSTKSISRRINQSIPVVVEDLPVNPDYLAAVKATGAKVFFRSKWLNAVLIEADNTELTAIQGLSFVSNVELVAPNSRLKSRSSSDNDGKVSKNNRTEELETAFQNNLLGVDLLHADGYQGQGVSIAFMDAGYKGVNTAAAFLHLFANDKLLMKYNLVENDTNVYQYDVHGTQVFGTVAGQIQNQYEGIATEADFMLFVTEDVPTEYRIEEYNFLFAAEMADSAGVDIINTSLGYNTFSDPSMNYTYEQMDGVTTIITQAAELAFSKGILVVTSVGNNGKSDTWPYLTAPADGKNVLSVGATDQSNLRANFSSIGPTSDGRIKPELMALGVSPALLNQNGDVIHSSNGTSFSSPQIAGLAALLWQSQPTLSNKELFDLMLSLGNRSENPDNNYGYGIPNYGKYITSVDETSKSIKPFPNPFSDYISLSGMAGSQFIQVDLIDANGKTILKQSFENMINDELTVDTRHFPSGIYILQLNGAKRQNLIQRMVKY
ncbi:MAG TPA: S8 family serine peptidase [Fulvivirga sp.]|nr:S8 family serine peptidase [Fulvivirga sp.]